MHSYAPFHIVNWGELGGIVVWSVKPDLDTSDHPLTVIKSVWINDGFPRHGQGQLGGIQKAVDASHTYLVPKGRGCFAYLLSAKRPWMLRIPT